MVCGRPFSETEKSSLARSSTISPLFVRTVASMLMTFTSVEKVESCWARRSGRTENQDATESRNWRLESIGLVKHRQLLRIHGCELDNDTLTLHNGHRLSYRPRFLTRGSYKS